MFLENYELQRMIWIVIFPHLPPFPSKKKEMFMAFWTLLVSCIPELVCQAGIKVKENLELPEMAGWFERCMTCSKGLIQCKR